MALQEPTPLLAASAPHSAFPASGQALFLARLAGPTVAGLAMAGRLVPMAQASQVRLPTLEDHRLLVELATTADSAELLEVELSAELLVEP